MYVWRCWAREREREVWGEEEEEVFEALGRWKVALTDQNRVSKRVAWVGGVCGLGVCDEEEKNGWGPGRALNSPGWGGRNRATRKGVWS